MKQEKLPVKIGLWTSDKPMTRMQAERLGRKSIPVDLKRAGFRVTVSRTDRELHGGDWFRVNYVKHY